MLFRQFCLFFKLKRSYVTDLYMINLVSFLSRHHKIRFQRSQVNRFSGLIPYGHPEQKARPHQASTVCLMK